MQIKRHFEQELMKDPRFLLALEHMPAEQRDAFKAAILGFAERLHTDIMLRFADVKARASMGMDRS